VTFIHQDLYSIYLLFILFIISISFVNDRKQMKNLILIPFKTKESYSYLYFQRNINFNFLRFLYLIIILFVSNSFIGILFKNLKIADFFYLLYYMLCFFIIKYISILLIGFLLKKYVKFKKILIINIDIKAFISMYFFPILIIISYSNLLNTTISILISILFITLLITTKIIYIIKSNNFIGLKFLDIISYICIIEIIPIIVLYNILK